MRAMVGRAAECAVLESLVGSSGAVVLTGEPGIGKSHLLAFLGERAAAAGCTVLAGRATEYEDDLPFGPWREALEPHLAELGERRVTLLGLEDPEALAAILPGLAPAAAVDRHRGHRALRDLLERLAAARPLVVCLDDVHWADPATVDALAALVRRPPAAPVLLAVAAREGLAPRALAGTQVVAVGPLSEAEAGELIGRTQPGVYAASGGNPFFLEQLARAPEGPVPATVTTALDAELARLSAPARGLLDAAAVAGDPFELDLAGAVAGLEPLAPLDELLLTALVRPTDAPRRFAFRHPIVRHAVYAAAPGGWRLGAHARAADVLRRRGAGPVELAHHVEHAAVGGDTDAVALLAGAADALRATAPAAAARFYAAALRLATADTRGLRWRLADAQQAAGDPAAARDTLLAALEAPGDERLALTVAVANADWALGRNADARRRLQVALADLPAAPSPDRVRLRLALTLTALEARDLREAEGHAGDARDDAQAIGDPVFEAAARASGAFAIAVQGRTADAERALAESVAALERLTPAELATRLPALWMHARTHRTLGRPEAALADLERGTALAERSGRDSQLLALVLETAATLIELGRLAEADEAAREGLERARLSGAPGRIAWAHSVLAGAALNLGDPERALREARAAATIGADPGVLAAGQPGWCLGAALAACGELDAGAAALAAAVPDVLPADRPALLADLAEVQIARGDVAAIEDPAMAPLAHATVLLARDQPREAQAAVAAALAGPPLTAARARLLEGRALAAAGDRPGAVAALRAAADAFAGFGAQRRAGEAVRELRKLGHRVVRPAEQGAGPLTAREQEVAELVAAGRTNREIAEQLVLSTRTIEAHLRAIYAKLGVRSRVELTRAVSA
jgi:DNA-binding NarL/FixJ family response regulator/tetratricopeptide (TPR) repeat protein